MELTKDVFELIFPQGVFEWFDLKESGKDEQTVHLTFEEKIYRHCLLRTKIKELLPENFTKLPLSIFR